MKTKLQKIALALSIFAISATHCNAQSLSTEHEDAVFQVSSIHGLSLFMIPVDAERVLYLTNSNLKNSKVELAFDIINLSDNSTKHLSTTFKGSYAGEPFYSDEKVFMAYAATPGGPQSILMVNIKKEEYTFIELSEYNKLAKKVRHIDQILASGDMVYFTGRTAGEHKVIGSYDVVNEDLAFKLYPKTVKSVSLQAVDDKTIICLSSLTDKTKFSSIIGQLEDDLTVSNETTFLKGEKRMVWNFQIQSTGNDSYFVSGIWCTSATPYGTYRPSAFWMHWNDGQIEDFNDILILNIKTGSALFTKEEKEDFTKNASKNGNDGDWTISIVSHEAGGGSQLFLQNDRTSFAIINTDSDGAINWSNAMSYAHPEVSPVSLNTDESHAYGTLKYDDGLFNVTYFDDKKIKSIDFSLDDGSVYEKNESSQLMLLQGENKKVIPLRFGLRISENEYILFQAFESGSKFTLDNSEYTRSLYVRRVLVD